MHRRAVLAALLAAPAARAAGPQAPLPVVASFSILADMTRQVGGDLVAVRSLVPPDGDAHTFEPRPSDLQAVAAARRLIVNGLGLEGWMDRLKRAAGYAGPVVVASAGVVPRRLADGSPDPHAWQDARNGASYARTVADGLAQADSARADDLRAAGERYARLILDTDAWIERTLSPIPPAKRRIITSHDAFGYYGARYGVTLLAAQGVSTEDEPSAAGIARLAAQIKRERIRAVFLETMVNPTLTRTLAQDSGAALGAPVYSDALSPPDGPAPTYVDMLRHNTSLFAAAMARNG